MVSIPVQQEAGSKCTPFREPLELWPGSSALIQQARKWTANISSLGQTFTFPSCIGFLERELQVASYWFLPDHEISFTFSKGEEEWAAPSLACRTLQRRAWQTSQGGEGALLVLKSVFLLRQLKHKREPCPGLSSQVRWAGSKENCSLLLNLLLKSRAAEAVQRAVHRRQGSEYWLVLVLTGEEKLFLVVLNGTTYKRIVRIIHCCLATSFTNIFMALLP